MEKRFYWLRLGVFGVLVALLMLEGLIRLFIVPTYYNPALVDQINLDYAPSYLASAIHLPNQSLPWQFPDEPEHRLNINEYGYRGDSIAIEKPDNTLRIMTLGGSAGFDAMSPNSWAHDLADSIDMSDTPYTIETVNASVSGYAAHDSSGRLRYEAWMFQPDVVLVYHCWNDLKMFSNVTPDYTLLQRETFSVPRLWTAFKTANFVGPIDRALGASHLYLFVRRVTNDPQVTQEGYIPPVDDRSQIQDFALEQYRLNLLGIVDHNRRIGAQTILVPQARLPQPDNTDDELERISLSYASLETHDLLLDAFAACDRIMADIAADEPDTHLLTGTENVPADLDHFIDHIHLTPTGSRALADIIGTWLDDFLHDQFADAS